MLVGESGSGKLFNKTFYRDVREDNGRIAWARKHHHRGQDHSFPFLTTGGEDSWCQNCDHLPRPYDKFGSNQYTGSQITEVIIKHHGNS